MGLEVYSFLKFMVVVLKTQVVFVGLKEEVVGLLYEHRILPDFNEMVLVFNAFLEIGFV